MGFGHAESGPLVRSSYHCDDKVPHVRACWLGRTPYREAWDLQRNLSRLCVDGDVPTRFSCSNTRTSSRWVSSATDHLLWERGEAWPPDVDVIWSESRRRSNLFTALASWSAYPILNLEHSHSPFLSTSKSSSIGNDYLRELGIDSTPGEPGLTGSGPAAKSLRPSAIQVESPDREFMGSPLT